MRARQDRRRQAVRAIALLLAALMVLGVLVSVMLTTAYAEGLDRCDLQLTMLEDLGAVGVTQTLTLTNRTAGPLDQMVFQLAANALRRQSTAPYESETMFDAYPDGFAAGGVELHRVAFNGRDAGWGVQGTDEAVLRVDCSLAPGESGTFEFGYEVLLPGCLGALGTGEIGWRLTGFYPLPAVWDGEGFTVERVSPVGDSLLALPMDYHVSVNLPETWQVATGGAVWTEPAGQGRANATVSVENARFFALALSRKYSRVQVVSASGVRVEGFANDRAAAARAAAAAARAVDVYSELFGPYPRRTLAAAQGDLLDSLSQAGLILLPERLFSLSARSELEYQVALTTAKQWFSEAVGFNPAEEPWLGESLSAYAALLYYEKTYGHDRYLKELNSRVVPSLQLTIPGGVTVSSEALAFGTVADYQAVVRGRGAAVMHELRALLGAEVLYDGMARYVRQNAGHIATGADFAAALGEASGRDVENLLAELLLNIGDYVGQDVGWYE
jgi:hypothetical protein